MFSSLVNDTLLRCVRVMCRIVYHVLSACQGVYCFFLQLKTLMVLYPVVNWCAGNGGQYLRGWFVGCMMYSFHTLPSTL